MNQAIPSLYELTAAQVATSMNEFIYSYVGVRHAIRRYRASTENMPRKARSGIRKLLRETEENLNLEKSQMITAAEHLYENALAHLMGHNCAVAPGFLEEVIDLIEETEAKGEPPVPQALSGEKVEHFRAIMEITHKFLLAMGSRMVNVDSPSPSV